MKNDNKMMLENEQFIINWLNSIGATNIKTNVLEYSKGLPIFFEATINLVSIEIPHFLEVRAIAPDYIAGVLPWTNSLRFNNSQSH